MNAFTQGLIVFALALVLFNIYIDMQQGDILKMGYLIRGNSYPGESFIGTNGTYNPNQAIFQEDGGTVSSQYQGFYQMPVMYRRLKHEGIPYDQLVKELGLNMKHYKVSTDGL